MGFGLVALLPARPEGKLFVKKERIGWLALKGASQQAQSLPPPLFLLRAIFFKTSYYGHSYFQFVAGESKTK